MQIEVTSWVCDALLAEAASAHPEECCGLLTGMRGRITGILPARNIHATPETHFEIDPRVLIDAACAMRDGGPDILGFYHSHPNGSPLPSETDRALAANDGRIWVIIASGSLSAFLVGTEPAPAKGWEPVTLLPVSECPKSR